MIIVTGGAGFIGSNLVQALNEKGRTDIVVVDDLKDSGKFRNLRDLSILDYWDRQDFPEHFIEGRISRERIDAVFHQGACSDTMETDGAYMMRNNFAYSRDLLETCLKRGIPFIYASSASVYGNGKNGFIETPPSEYPLNVYAYSKLLFDQHVRRVLPGASSQVVGLRYFNVFGPGETHKGRMASIAYHARTQLKETGTIRLFKGTEGYGDGEQKRDFVYVKDVCGVNLFFHDHPGISGIFNCGTGRARTFNDIARVLVAREGQGRVEYVPMPESLLGKYQNFTEADLTKLRKAGYASPFTSLETALNEYALFLDSLEEINGKKRGGGFATHD